MKQEMKQREENRNSEEDFLAVKADVSGGGQSNELQKRRSHQQQHRKESYLLGYKTELESIKEFDSEALEALKQKVLKANLQKQLDQTNKRLQHFGSKREVIPARPNVLLQCSSFSEKNDRKTAQKQHTETTFAHDAISSEPLLKDPTAFPALGRNRANTLPTKQLDGVRSYQETMNVNILSTGSLGMNKTFQDQLEEHFNKKGTSSPYHFKTSDSSFSSSVFPPLTEKQHDSKMQINSSPHEKSSEKVLQTENTADFDDTGDAISQLAEEYPSKTQTLAAIMKEESERLNKKIKDFVAKPIPSVPPSSLKIRRSTVHDIKLESFSKRIPTEPVPVFERRRTHGIINMHTCPNLISTDRSWMYQDRPGQKCRYIRTPQSPIPPINQIFDGDE